MITRLTKYFFVFLNVLTVLLILAQAALAQNPFLAQIVQVQCGGEGQSECGLCQIFQIIYNVNRFLVGVGLAITTAVFVWGGIVMMTAAGSEERFRKGKANLRAGIIGMIIVLASFLIISTIINLLAGTDNAWWAQPGC